MTAQPLTRHSYNHNGFTIMITRTPAGTAYPRNGTPTVYYRWVPTVNGVRLSNGELFRRDALNLAQQVIDSGEIHDLLAARSRP